MGWEKLLGSPGMGSGIPICRSLGSQDSMQAVMVCEVGSRQGDQMASLLSTLEWIPKKSLLKQS